MRLARLKILWPGTIRTRIAGTAVSAALLAIISTVPVAVAETTNANAGKQTALNAGNDYDGDGMQDIWETNVGLNPFSSADAHRDRDNDGVDNLSEFTIGIDPNNVDSDGDGLTDGEEVNSAGSDPGNADTDADQISDFWEIFYGLNPFDPADAGYDIDEDGFTNLEEILAGTDPCDTNSSPIWETPAAISPLPATPPVRAAQQRGSGDQAGGLITADSCKPTATPDNVAVVATEPEQDANLLVPATAAAAEPIAVTANATRGESTSPAEETAAAIKTAETNPLPDSDAAGASTTDQDTDHQQAPAILAAAAIATATANDAIGTVAGPLEGIAANADEEDANQNDSRPPAATADDDSGLGLLEATTLGLSAGDSDLPETADSMRTPEAETGMALTVEPAATGTMLAASPVPGHERLLEVPRLEPADDPSITPVIDGNLDDPAWQQADVSESFWNSMQNSQPTNQTEVLVMMDDQNLYFGFRVYDDDVEAIQATSTVRDVGLGYDDSITVQLDTFFNRRDISSFSVNPLGTQSDDIAGGRSAKIEWKGDWQGAARRTEYGWEAEIAIPFSILNFNSDANRFGVNFRRYQSRTKEYSYWADITPQSRGEEMGQLSGLTLPELTEKKVWSFMPFVLAGKDIPDKEGEVQDTLVSAGIDIRYQPRPDLTGLLALNPDFSQVEEAVTDISFSYTERRLDDNRPFFVEGAALFSPKKDDDQYFYSNRVPDFDAGAKSFGRVGATQFGVLASVAPDDRIDFAGRTLFEVDETNSAIATVVTTDQTDFDNTLLVAQFNGRQPNGLNYAVDAAFTDTANVTDPEEAPAGDGSHFMGALGWSGDHLYIKGEADKYETNYFPANALLDSDLPGTEGASLTTGFYQEMSHPMFQVVDTYVGTAYRETETGEKQQEKVYAQASVELSNETRLGMFIEDGPYRPVTDERGVFEDTLNNDRYYSVFTDFNTRSSKFSGGLQYDWGDLGGGPYKYYSAYGWWRPVNPLYFSLSAERTDSFGISDQVVAVMAWNITPQNALAGRYIYSEGENIYRLAYSYKPRKGLDIFAVFDTDTTESYEFSVKLVKIF